MWSIRTKSTHHIPPPLSSPFLPQIQQGPLMPVAPTMGAVPTSAYPDLAMRRPVLVPQDLSCLQMAHAVNSMNHMQLCPPISTSEASMLTAPTTQRRWCLLVDVCWMMCKLFNFSVYYILTMWQSFSGYIFCCCGSFFLQHLTLARARSTYIFNLALCITLTTAHLLHIRASIGLKQVEDIPWGWLVQALED